MNLPILSPLVTSRLWVSIALLRASVFSRFFFANFSALMAAFSASTSARSCREASFATCDFSFGVR